jgi:transposase-like protein
MADMSEPHDEAADIRPSTTSGIRLPRTSAIISDAHPGLVAAIGSALPGASWQRCRTHYLRNLLTRVPKSAQPHVATQVRTIFDQADADAVNAQFDRFVDALTIKYPDAAAHLEAAARSCWPSRAIRTRSGVRSGRTIPRNG